MTDRPTTYANILDHWKKGTLCTYIDDLQKCGVQEIASAPNGIGVVFLFDESKKLQTGFPTDDIQTTVEISGRSGSSRRKFFEHYAFLKFTDLDSAERSWDLVRDHCWSEAHTKSALRGKRKK